MTVTRNSRDCEVILSLIFHFARHQGFKFKRSVTLPRLRTRNNAALGSSDAKLPRVPIDRSSIC